MPTVLLNNKLRTLSDVFKPGRIYNTRPSYSPYGVIPGSESEWNDRQGAILCMTGEIRTLQPEGVFTPVGEALILGAGIPYVRREDALVYRNREEYETLLGGGADHSLFLDHPHPPGEVPESAYLVPKKLCDALIDKIEMARWVPEHLLPERVVAARESAYERIPPFLKEDGCCVIKSTGPFPTGGGAGVEYVSAPEQFSSAVSMLAGQGDIIIERWHESPVTYCLNFAVTEFDPEHPVYVGAAEQIIGQHVKYKGNWVDPSCRPDRGAIESAMEVANNIAASGYRGILGIDVLMPRDSEPLIVDINPRMNGSTPMLFLESLLRKSVGDTAVLRSHVFFLRDSNIPDMIHAAIKEKRLFPYRLFQYPDGGEFNYKCGAIAAGESKEDVIRLFESMRDAGIQV